MVISNEKPYSQRISIRKVPDTALTFVIVKHPEVVIMFMPKV